MTRKQRIESEIEAAFKSVDHLVPASPAPFFYTRVSARLMKEETNVWGRASRLITRPAIAALSVVLIITVNVFAVIHHNKPATANLTAEQAELAMADEYNSASLYTIDNLQP